MKKSLLAFTALCLSLSVSACSTPGTNAAQTQQQKEAYHQAWLQHYNDNIHVMAEDLFAAMDTDGDGVITHKEYNDHMRKWFKQADTDHDGELTLEEVEAQMNKDGLKSIENHRKARQNEGCKGHVPDVHDQHPGDSSDK